MPDLQGTYTSRRPLLEELAAKLESHTKEELRGLDHIDRISFRAKGVHSFVEKATDPTNNPPYGHPLEEIEDQVAGRVIVFFRSDIEIVKSRLLGAYTSVERKSRRPAKDEEFGYESEHLICLIPPQLKSEAWEKMADMPVAFELQVRTLFMHAWAEPQHDIGYKAASDLPSNVKRELAWIAASAWGADQGYERILEWDSIAKKQK